MRFDEDAATELASWFIHWSGDAMDGLKLMKLLYITERRAIQHFNHPILFDRLVSMDRGPLCSTSYDLLKSSRTAPDQQQEHAWFQWISIRHGNDVHLLQRPPRLQHLSEAEQELAHEVFAEFRDKDPMEVSLLTHDFPEWENPQGSSLPIGYRQLLNALGKNREEQADFEESLEARELLAEVFA